MATFIILIQMMFAFSSFLRCGSMLSLVLFVEGLSESKTNDLNSSTWRNLLNICEPNGTVNPRTACTDGHANAAQYVAQEMQKYNMTPLGDNNTFIQEIPGSENDSLCPPGILNVVGMVQGTQPDDEYVVYMATLSGSVNRNPQTEANVTRNKDFSFAYDSGFSVAAGLAIAAETVKEPPLRSVIFLFCGAGHGWNAVGKREEPQKHGSINAFREDTDWFTNVCGAITSNVRDHYKPACDKINLIGFTYWIKRWEDEFDLSKIKLFFYADKLGSSFGSEQNILILIGGEQMRLEPNGPTLFEFFDETANNNNIVLIPIPVDIMDKDIFDNYEDKYFFQPCGGTLCPGGLPIAWFVQPAFQMMGDQIDLLRFMFGKIQNSTEKFPGTVYFAPDNLKNLYKPHVGQTVSTLFSFVLNVANTSNTSFSFSKSDFSEEKGSQIQQLKHYIRSLQSYIQYQAEFNSTVKDFLGSILEVQSSMLEQANENSTDVDVRAIYENIAVVFVSLDYFNPNYPIQEPYRNQYLGDNPTESEIQPTLAPSQILSPLEIVFLIMSIVLFVVALLFRFQISKQKNSDNPTDQDAISALQAYAVSSSNSTISPPSQSSAGEHDRAMAHVLSIFERLSSLREPEETDMAPFPILEESFETFLASWTGQSSMTKSSISSRQSLPCYKDQVGEKQCARLERGLGDSEAMDDDERRSEDSEDESFYSCDSYSENA
jgi:hypothetical protein